MSEDIDVSELPARLADERQALRDLVEGRDQAAIARRPVCGKWSVIEHLRHLLFAEQAHLDGYVPGGRQSSPAGYTPQTMRKTQDLARSAGLPQPTLSEMLAAWDAPHPMLADAQATQDSPAIRAALARNLNHLRRHGAVVQRLVGSI